VQRDSGSVASNGVSIEKDTLLAGIDSLLASSNKRQV
jgi:hypothetical protein